MTVAAQGAAPDPSRIRAALRGAVDAGRVPAVAAAVGSRDAAVFQEGFGAPADALFRIFSMTKPVTSVALLQLAEAGKVRLDDPAAKFLPALAGAQVLEGFDASGKPQLRPAKSPVTVRQLLSHSAGFGYDIWSADLTRYFAAGGAGSLAKPGDEFLRAPLLFDPGADWAYGTNTDICGRIVETVSGEPLAAYFEKHIFGPLAMRDTSFSAAGRENRVIAVHVRQPDGTFAGTQMPAGSANPRGGAGLLSTAPDYLRFLRCLLNGGTLDGVRILKEETVREMGRNQIGKVNVRRLATANPGLSRDLEISPGVPAKFGLGFWLNQKPLPEGRGAGSLAWAGILNTYFWIDPRGGVAAVLLLQFRPFLDPAAIETLAAFERAVYGR